MLKGGRGVSIGRIVGFIVLIGGLWLTWAQSQGALTYMSRGASFGDAFGGATPLIIGTAALTAIAGVLAGADMRASKWVAMIALALNLVILFLTLQLGAGRLAWIVGAAASAALLASIALSFTAPRRS
ncbi:MAG: hypothetical protein AAFX03_11335 [Pseudomonadota bacterium]